jgi:hypothetical protein
MKCSLLRLLRFLPKRERPFGELPDELPQSARVEIGLSYPCAKKIYEQKRHEEHDSTSKIAGADLALSFDKS